MKPANVKIPSSDNLTPMTFNTSKFSSLDEETLYLNKIEVTESNTKTLSGKILALRYLEVTKKSEVVKNIAKSVEEHTAHNAELKKQFILLEEQLQTLTIESKQIEERKQKYYNDIIKLRKESTKEIDQKVNLLVKQDKNVKLLKKELFLLMNLLKIRVVNLDVQEEENMIKGYLVNTDKNFIKYIEINKNEEMSKNCFSYWQQMKDLLEPKPEKENVNNLNNKLFINN